MAREFRAVRHPRPGNRAERLPGRGAARQIDARRLRAPRAPSPRRAAGSTLTTPGGAPLAARISPSLMTEPGASSDGLTTAVLPVARRGLELLRRDQQGMIERCDESAAEWDPLRRRADGRVADEVGAPSVVSASDA